MITGRISIHKRLEIANNRERFGDWDIDLIEGKNHKNFILSMVRENRHLRSSQNSKINRVKP
jgi:IS30 family transposase